VTSTAERFEEALFASLRRGWTRRVEGARAAGRALPELGSADDLAERMLAALPILHPWDVQVGPFYDTAGLTGLLGVSKQAVADRVRRGTLLAVTTSDGRVVYPAWQLRGRTVLPGLARVLAVLTPAAGDAWTVAAWLTTPAADLEGMTPARWLRDREEPERVVALARSSALRWAG